MSSAVTMSLAEKTKIALDESRMLMLGAQILLGFQFHAPFQDGFSRLSPPEKATEIIVLHTIVIVIALLITPSARHRIVERGEDAPTFNRFVTQIAMITLAPLALALSLDLYVAGNLSLGSPIGAVMGLIGGLAAIGLWYGPCVLRNSEGGPAVSTSNEKTSHAAKINYVLTEARVVLPGVQALLGFQLVIVLTTSFADLSAGAKAIHGMALGFVALAIMLLIAPAAYHRIVYEGADVPEFYRIAGRFLLLATIFLALGLSADIQVVTAKITGNEVFANITAIATAMVLFGLWHIWPYWLRIRARKP